MFAGSSASCLLLGNELVGSENHYCNPRKLAPQRSLSSLQRNSPTGFGPTRMASSLRWLQATTINLACWLQANATVPDPTCYQSLPTGFKPAQTAQASDGSKPPQLTKSTTPLASGHASCTKSPMAPATTIALSASYRLAQSSPTITAYGIGRLEKKKTKFLIVGP